MAQKPVASPFILELEPVVDENYDRHVATATPWYAHDYVPFEKGDNFTRLGGRDWDPSQVTLPSHITDALEIMLITKGNLAGYHREFVEQFMIEGAWGKWVGRWTAEESLHAIALREYLVVTREVDPVTNEIVRAEHVMKGDRADDYTQVETLVFMTLLERTHALFLRRLAAQIEEPNLRSLVETIAADEERHEEFFSELVRACLRIVPAATIAAIISRAAELQVVGADVDAYQDKVKNVAEAGIFGEDQLRQAISDRIRAWNLAKLPELSGFVVN
jgi:acyl-[acyl-carrier-protein] desaturase